MHILHALQVFIRANTSQDGARILPPQQYLRQDKAEVEASDVSAGLPLEVQAQKSSAPAAARVDDPRLAVPVTSPRD